MLLCTVGVKELTADVTDGLAVPGHCKSGVGLYTCNNGSLEVFLSCEGEEGCLVFLFDNYCHSLLRLGDSKLGAVKTVVLLGNCVKVDIKTVSKLTDSNGNAACAKVVTTLDHSGNGGVSEKTLDLSFLGCVTLLNLCTAVFKGLKVVGLGGAGSTAAAVTTRSAAEKDNDVAILGALTSYVSGRSGSDNCTDLHMLCRIAVVINFINYTGCKTDLVTVGGIAVSRS